MKEELVKSIAQDLQDFGSDLPESFCRILLRRLDGIGYQAEDSFPLAFSVRKAEVEILDYCHIDLIPSVLYPLLTDRAIGKYLYDLKQTGNLDMEALDLSGAVSELKEGDVSISFSGSSDEAKLDQLLQAMMEAGKGQLACYRKIRF